MKTFPLFVRASLVLFLAFLLGSDKMLAQTMREAYVVASTDKTLLTFYCDRDKSTRTGTVYTLNTGTERPQWVSAVSATCKTVTFDSSFTYAPVTTTAYWFYRFTKLTKIAGFNYLRMSQVTNMSHMFEGCSSLTELYFDYALFQTQNVTDMSYMFSQCSCLERIKWGARFSTENVTTMARMFSTCIALESLDLSGFTTEKVTTMEGMFTSCRVLPSLDLRSFDTQNVQNMQNMFSGCSKLTTIQVSTKWSTKEVLNS